MLLLLTPFLANAQDFISLKKGENIKSKVLEVTADEIKYKKFDFQEGPTYSAKKADVLSIRYSNGDEEVFTTEATKAKKMYIFKPSYKLNDFPEIELPNDLYLVIDDKRAIPPKKSMIKYSGKELVDELLKIFKDKSGNKSINILSSKSMIPKGSKAIYVAIGAYDATFYPGAWHTQARYYVEVIDGPKMVNKEIESLKGAFNTFGASTAKSRLSKSFEEATTQLLEFINQNKL